jgi:T4-like virus tail tube protein gp19
MAGTINDFLSTFQSDLARPNRFDVSIPIPLVLIQYRNIAQKLTFRCENANLPGRTLNTTDQKIYNIVEKFPNQTSYQDMDLTFIVGGDMAEKQFFDAWMEYINPSTNFNFKFKGDYSTSITINQYDVNNNLTYTVELIDAFPIAVNQMDLDWSNDGIHKLTVVFAYTYWKNNSLNNVLQSAVTGGIGGTISQLTGGTGLGGNLF